jgi:putative hydrolase of the HAD superfamily
VDRSGRRPPMTPAAILFDLDDTILTCPGGDFVKLWRKSVEEHIHLFQELTADELFSEIRSVAKKFWSDPDRHRTGRLEIQAARQMIVATAASNLNRGDEEAAAVLANHYHAKREFDVVPFDGALETLEHFRRSPTKMALITNGASEIQRGKIDKYQLDQYFDVVLIEGEFGMGKPEPGVYSHVVQELGVAVGESWIVGDNLEWEVRVPQQLGFHTIWNDFSGRGLPPGHDVVPDRIVTSIHELVEVASVRVEP